MSHLTPCFQKTERRRQLGLCKQVAGRVGGCWDLACHNHAQCNVGTMSSPQPCRGLLLACAFCFSQNPSTCQLSISPTLASLCSHPNAVWVYGMQVMPSNIVFHVLHDSTRSLPAGVVSIKACVGAPPMTLDWGWSRGCLLLLWVSRVPGALGSPLSIWVSGCCCHNSNKCVPEVTKLTAVNCTHARYSLWCTTHGY